MSDTNAKHRLEQFQKMAFLPALIAGATAAAPWLLKNIGGAMLTNFVADKALGAITGDKGAAPEAAPQAGAPAAAPVPPRPVAPTPMTPRPNPRSFAIPWRKFSAESKTAFQYGFDAFYKNAGFDAEDRTALFELAKHAFDPADPFGYEHAAEQAKEQAAHANENWSSSSQPQGGGRHSNQGLWGWNGRDGQPNQTGAQSTAPQQVSAQKPYTPGFFDQADDAIFGGSSEGANAKPQGLFSSLSDSLFGSPEEAKQQEMPGNLAASRMGAPRGAASGAAAGNNEEFVDSDPDHYKAMNPADVEKQWDKGLQDRRNVAVSAAHYLGHRNLENALTKAQETAAQWGISDISKLPENEQNRLFAHVNGQLTQEGARIPTQYTNQFLRGRVNAPPGMTPPGQMAAAPAPTVGSPPAPAAAPKPAENPFMPNPINAPAAPPATPNALQSPPPGTLPSWANNTPAAPTPSVGPAPTPKPIPQAPAVT